MQNRKVGIVVEGHDEGRSTSHLDEVGVTPISDEVTPALFDTGAGEAVLDEEGAPL